MKEVFRNLEIIPISKILLHEGIVNDWIAKLSNIIDHDGFLKNPIIVTQHNDQYIALDGMHRICALRQLGCRDILVYRINYMDDSIKLFGWDAMILDQFPLEKLLKSFAHKENLVYREHTNYEEATKNIISRQSCFALVDQEDKIIELVMEDDKKNLEIIIRILKDFELEIDQRKLKTIYIADEQSKSFFKEHENAHFLVRRPYFTKEEIIERTIEGKLFPRKSTRHVFPLRPLRVDIDLILLKEDMDINLKNQLLQSRLNWCLENSMVRYYPESVLVFSD